MTKEKMTIAGLIAEGKKITKKMEEIVSDNSFTILTTTNLLDLKQ